MTDIDDILARVRKDYQNELAEGLLYAGIITRLTSHKLLEVTATYENGPLAQPAFLLDDGFGLYTRDGLIATYIGFYHGPN